MCSPRLRQPSLSLSLVGMLLFCMDFFVPHAHPTLIQLNWIQCRMYFMSLSHSVCRLAVSSLQYWDLRQSVISDPVSDVLWD